MTQWDPFLLAELLAKPLASIEILPGGLGEWTRQTSGTTEEFPFVLVDNHLGIPQKVLYKLYMVAIIQCKNPSQPTISALSSVILLANPAHQTMLNARKRFILGGLLDADRELTLMSLFIRGSKDCAKQSVIWDHRRWIFRHRCEHTGNKGSGWERELHGRGTEALDSPRIPLDTLRKECELIRWACELYPRNYHAWAHYRWVLDLVWATVSNVEGSGGVNQEDSVDFLRKEVVGLREWISRHVSDYSAIHLLCSIAVLDAQKRLLAECGRGSLVDELREHALDLVIAYPAHEALWLYLRNTLSLCPSDNTRDVVDKLSSREGVSLDMIKKYIHSH